MKKIEHRWSPTEPVDPRVQRTRKLLQDALRSLILEKRFAAISVQDIAERATVNRATFYAHYTGKEDLAASVLKTELREALMRRFAEHPTLTHETLVELAVAVFEFMGNKNDACPETAVELQESVGTTLQQSLYEMMAMWLSRNPASIRLFPGCTKETVATVLSWSIYGGARQWSETPRRAPALQVCQEIVSILLPPLHSSVSTTPTR